MSYLHHLSAKSAGDSALPSSTTLRDERPNRGGVLVGRRRALQTDGDGTAAPDDDTTANSSSGRRSNTLSRMSDALIFDSSSPPPPPKPTTRGNASAVAVEATRVSGRGKAAAAAPPAASKDGKGAAAPPSADAAGAKNAAAPSNSRRTPNKRAVKNIFDDGDDDDDAKEAMASNLALLASASSEGGPTSAAAPSPSLATTLSSVSGVTTNVRRSSGGWLGSLGFRTTINESLDSPQQQPMSAARHGSSDDDDDATVGQIHSQFLKRGSAGNPATAAPPTAVPKAGATIVAGVTSPLVPRSLASLLEAVETLTPSSVAGHGKEGASPQSAATTTPPSVALLDGAMAQPTTTSAGGGGGGLLGTSWSPFGTRAQSPSAHPSNTTAAAAAASSLSPSRSASFARGVASFLATTARSVTAMFTPPRTSMVADESDVPPPLVLEGTGLGGGGDSSSSLLPPSSPLIVYPTTPTTPAAGGRSVGSTTCRSHRSVAKVYAGTNSGGTRSRGRSMFSDEDDEDDDVPLAKLRIAKGNTMKINRRTHNANSTPPLSATTSAANSTSPLRPHSGAATAAPSPNSRSGSTLVVAVGATGADGAASPKGLSRGPLVGSTCIVPPPPPSVVADVDTVTVPDAGSSGSGAAPPLPPPSRKGKASSKRVLVVPPPPSNPIVMTAGSSGKGSSADGLAGVLSPDPRRDSGALSAEVGSAGKGKGIGGGDDDDDGAAVPAAASGRRAVGKSARAAAVPGEEGAAVAGENAGAPSVSKGRRSESAAVSSGAVEGHGDGGAAPSRGKMLAQPPPLPPAPSASTVGGGKKASGAASSVGRKSATLSPSAAGVSNEPPPLDMEAEVQWLRKANEYLFDLLPQEVKEENFDDSAVPNPNPQALLSADLADEGASAAAASVTGGARFTVKVGVDLYKKLQALLARFVAALPQQKTAMGGGGFELSFPHHHDASSPPPPLALEGCRAVSQLVDTLLKMRVKRVHASLLQQFLPFTLEALQYTYPALGDPSHYRLAAARRMFLHPLIPLQVPSSIVEAVERAEAIEDLLGVLVAPCDEVSFVGITSHQQRLQESIAESILSSRFFSHLIEAIRSLRPAASSDGVYVSGGPIFANDTHSAVSGAAAAATMGLLSPPNRGGPGAVGAASGRGSKGGPLALLLSPDSAASNTVLTLNRLCSPSRGSTTHSSGNSSATNTVAAAVAVAAYGMSEQFSAASGTVELSPNAAAQMLWRTFFEAMEVLLAHHPNIGLLLHALRGEKVVGLLCQGLTVRYDDWPDVAPPPAVVQQPTAAVGRKRGRSVSPPHKPLTPPPLHGPGSSPRPTPTAHPRLCAMLINRIMQANNSISHHFTYQVSVFDAAWHCLLPPLYASPLHSAGMPSSSSSSGCYRSAPPRGDVSLQQEMLEAIYCLIKEGGDEVRAVLMRGEGGLSPGGARQGQGAAGDAAAAAPHRQLQEAAAGARGSTAIAGGRRSGSASNTSTNNNKGRRGANGADTEDGSADMFAPLWPAAAGSRQGSAAGGKPRGGGGSVAVVAVVPPPPPRPLVLPVDHFVLGIETAANPMPLLSVAACLLEGSRAFSMRFGDSYVAFHYACLVAVHNRLLRACGLVDEAADAQGGDAAPHPAGDCAKEEGGSKGASKTSPKRSSAAAPLEGTATPKASKPAPHPHPSSSAASSPYHPALQRRSSSPSSRGGTPTRPHHHQQQHQQPFNGSASSSSLTLHASSSSLSSQDAARRRAVARVRRSADLLLHCCKYLHAVLKADPSLVTLQLMAANGATQGGGDADGAAALGPAASSSPRGGRPRGGGGPSAASVAAAPADVLSPVRAPKGTPLRSVPLYEGLLEAMQFVEANVRRQSLVYGRAADVAAMLRGVRAVGDDLEDAGEDAQSEEGEELLDI